MEYISNSPAETEALGEALAARLTAGTVVAFTGDLGAGKTAFTRGLARGRTHENIGPGVLRHRLLGGAV